MSELDLSTINAQLRDAHPKDIIKWALGLKKKTIVTTNFGPFEAVILHLIHQQRPETPVICVDHGYNTEATYRFAAELSQTLELNMHYYTPKVTRARREATLNGVPSIDNEDAHNQFTEEVKLEPFRRAMDEWQPQLWLTAIRKEQTPFRDSLDIVTQDAKTGVIKVAPLFYWSELDMEEYLYTHSLPNEEDYNDPTKVLKNRECGLHTS